MTVEEKLKALYQLQTIYTEIDKIKTLRGELPLEVQDLEDEIAGLQTRVQNFQTDLNTMKSADVEYRRTIERAQSLVDKYTGDLDNVRNNREFDALNKEIEFENLEIELANKRLREGAAKQRICIEEIEKIRAIIADKELMLDEKKSELDDIISETRQKEEELRREKAKKQGEKVISDAGKSVAGTAGREVGNALGSAVGGKFGKKIGGNLGATLCRGLFATLFSKKK